MDQALKVIQLVVGSALILVCILILAFYFIQSGKDTKDLILAICGIVAGIVTVYLSL